ncbi:hypothetical protein EHS25_007949 [Saitozyma podzolica]|uniref:Uncharacterized protein n=1 Tax=Saitozyma podzolica TaxID=1890683 RepID=A0A427XL55_9TREE|nr:hypothetical protein EHS25_007949 [Saitozyma podzolica]
MQQHRVLSNRVGLQSPRSLTRTIAPLPSRSAQPAHPTLTVRHAASAPVLRGASSNSFPDIKPDLDPDSADIDPAVVINTHPYDLSWDMYHKMFMSCRFRRTKTQPEGRLPTPPHDWQITRDPELRQGDVAMSRHVVQLYLREHTRRMTKDKTEHPEDDEGLGRLVKDQEKRRGKRSSAGYLPDFIGRQDKASPLVKALAHLVVFKDHSGQLFFDHRHIEWEYIFNTGLKDHAAVLYQTTLMSVIRTWKLPIIVSFPRERFITVLGQFSHPDRVLREGLDQSYNCRSYKPSVNAGPRRGCYTIKDGEPCANFEIGRRERCTLYQNGTLAETEDMTEKLSRTVIRSLRRLPRLNVEEAMDALREAVEMLTELQTEREITNELVLELMGGWQRGGARDESE